MLRATAAHMLDGEGLARTGRELERPLPDRPEQPTLGASDLGLGHRFVRIVDALQLVQAVADEGATASGRPPVRTRRRPVPDAVTGISKSSRLAKPRISRAAMLRRSARMKRRTASAAPSDSGTAPPRGRWRSNPPGLGHPRRGSGSNFPLE